MGRHAGWWLFFLIATLTDLKWNRKAYKGAKLTEDFDQAKNQLLEKVQFLGLYHVPQVAV